MAATVTCSHCQVRLRIPEEHLGKNLRCPRCRNTFVGQAVPEASEATSAAPPPPEENRVTTAPAAQAPEPAAERLRPRESPPPPEDDDEPVELEPVENDDRQDSDRKDSPRPRRRRKKKPKGIFQRLGLPSVAIEPGLVKLGMSVLLGALGLVAGFFTVRALFRPSPPPVIAEKEWQLLDVPGRCKVLLPGVPKQQSQNAGGIEMVMHSVDPAGDNRASYGIGYSQTGLPPQRRELPVDQLLNDACDGSVARLKSMTECKEVKREDIQLGDYPGKELVVAIPAARGKMITRVYMAKGRLYMLIAGAKGLETDHKNVKRMFESFDIQDDGSLERAARAKPGNLPIPRPAVVEKPPEEVKPAPGLVRVIDLPAGASGIAIRFSPDGRTLAVGTRGGAALWYDADAGKLLTSGKNQDSIRTDSLGAAISPDATRVAFYRHGGLLYLVEAASPDAAVVIHPEGPSGIALWKAAFSPDGKFICTSHGDSTCRVWDVAERKLAHELKGFKSQVGSTAYRPDGSLLACGDLTVQLWDTKNVAEPLAKLAGGESYFFSGLAFTPDGKTLAGIKDRTVHVWRLGDDATKFAAAPRRELHHLAPVKDILFSPDGRQLLSGLANGNVQVTDVETLKPLGVVTPFAFTRHLPARATGGASGVAPLAFRGTTRQLAVGHGDRVLLIDLDKALAK
ncbi:MAG: hypothetical protein U0736_19240 [Gemmataceae bacterium]